MSNHDESNTNESPGGQEHRVPADERPPGPSSGSSLIPAPIRPATAAASSFSTTPHARPTPAAAPGRLPFDPWRLGRSVGRRWYWLVLGTVVAGAVAGGTAFWRGSYSVQVTLTLRDLAARFSAAGKDAEAYRPPQLAGATMVNFLASPELLGFVSSHAQPPMTERDLLSSLTIRQDQGSETVHATLHGKNPADLVALANLYAAAAVEKSRAAQKEDPAGVLTNFNHKLAELDLEQAGLGAKLAALRAESGMVDPAVENPALEKEWIDLRVKSDIARGELALIDSKQTLLITEPLRQDLQEAGARLRVLQAQGKLDEHPDVRRVRDQISQLTRQLDETGTNSNAGASGGLYAAQLTLAVARKRAAEAEIRQYDDQAAALKKRLDQIYEHTGEHNRLKGEFDRLENYKRTLNNRKFEAQQYLDNAEGYYRPQSGALGLADVDARVRSLQSVIWAGTGGVLGFFASLGLVLLVELGDPRIKTEADVRRVTRLPVLAGLGDLNQMDAKERRAWAFRTWTILYGTLAQSSHPGIVCGLISAAHGEGRSTWVNLLAEAARERGYEVTKVDCAEAGGAGGSPGKEGQFKNDARPHPGPMASQARHEMVSQQETIASRNVVPQEREMAAAASGALVPRAGAAGAVAQIQLPGLVWNLERRLQFQSELDQWRSVSRAVILIDLPPASVPEAILLAEGLPQLLWLADAGRSHTRDTRMHLETLHHAHCKLIGAVLNHQPKP